MAQTGSIQLIEIDESDKFIFGRHALEKLQELLLSEDVKNCSVVVISVNGAFRTGKSFLLSFFLRYLNFKYPKNSSPKGKSWLDDENIPLEGFEWRGGEERCTTGIQMWPEIFHATLPSGEKVAIILLDTQGLFDTKTTIEVNTKIFALSTMMNSLNIYNVSRRIQENNLEFLKFSTDYGAEAVRVRGNTSRGAPFGKLLFLLRDWSSPGEYPYGYAGSEKMMNDVLQVKDDQKPELQSVRRLIKSAFSKIDAFLMPSPGYNVEGEDPKFDGRLSDIRPLFKNSLKELVPSLLSPENLIIKKIEGRKVTAVELFKYISLYVDKLNSDEMPSAKGVFEANAELSYRLAYEDAIVEYVRQMDILCCKGIAVEESVLTKHHEEYSESSQLRFCNYRAFHDEKLFGVYEKKVKEEISRLYDSYRKSNQEKKEKKELNDLISGQKAEMDGLRTDVRDLRNKNYDQQKNITNMYDKFATDMRSAQNEHIADARRKQEEWDKERKEQKKRDDENAEKWRQLAYEARMNQTRSPWQVIGEVLGGAAMVVTAFKRREEH